MGVASGRVPRSSSLWIAPGLMEAVMTGRITAMGQRKYSLELRGRVTRMALEARADPDRPRGAVRWIAEEQALRNYGRFSIMRPVFC